MRKPKNNRYRKREFITQSAKKRKMGAERVGPTTERGYKVKRVSKMYKMVHLEFTNDRLATIEGERLVGKSRTGQFYIYLRCV